MGGGGHREIEERLSNLQVNTYNFIISFFFLGLFLSDFGTEGAYLTLSTGTHSMMTRLNWTSSMICPFPESNGHDPTNI